MPFRTKYNLILLRRHGGRTNIVAGTHVKDTFWRTAAASEWFGWTAVVVAAIASALALSVTLTSIRLAPTWLSRMIDSGFDLYSAGAPDRPEGRTTKIETLPVPSFLELARKRGAC